MLVYCYYNKLPRNCKSQLTFCNDAHGESLLIGRHGGSNLYPNDPNNNSSYELGFYLLLLRSTMNLLLRFSFCAHILHLCWDLEKIVQFHACPNSSNFEMRQWKYGINDQVLQKIFKSRIYAVFYCFSRLYREVEPFEKGAPPLYP